MIAYLLGFATLPLLAFVGLGVLMLAGAVADWLYGTPAEQYRADTTLDRRRSPEMQAFMDLPAPTARRGGMRYPAPAAGQVRTPGPDEPVLENLPVAGDDLPDPDKDDCPFWLPLHESVPFADKTPCRLDAAHDGAHLPVDLERWAAALHTHVITPERTPTP